MPQTITLVPCVKTKQDQPAPAADLYTSFGFQLARAYAEHHGTWLILSAKHGVVHPIDVIEPYDETLNTQGREQRRAWAKGVVSTLLDLSQPGDTFRILAGERYRENLVHPLREAGRQVTIPIQGMPMGVQRQWLGQELQRLGVERPRRHPSAQRAKPISRTVPREERIAHLQRFYSLLDRLRQGLAGGALLGELQRTKTWPERGVYFFFEGGEDRSDSGTGPRVVRVGTHAVASGSRSSLWGRLKQHRGGNDGAGNHRGSVFRKLVGASLAGRDPALAVDSWGQGNTASGEVPRLERELEIRVSTLLRAMPVLWLDIDDEPSKHSLRSYIERNSIALLSNYRTDQPLDAHSPHWLGAHCPKPKIRDSHLWNSNHVDESYDPAFLQVMEQLITAQLEGRTVEGNRRPEAPAETPRKPRQVEAKTSGGVRTRGEKSHYDLISKHLQASGQTTLTATIDEVNTWTDGRLPESAYKHQAWWSNSKATYRHLGWKASPRFEDSAVTFRRISEDR